jgi:nanoRNase/pAp phosphatase (c-di-AMP/oligoRNAs hydrolase)
MYAILGCGTVGHSVAETLQSRKRRVVVVDRSADRLASLQDKGFETVIADITKPEEYHDRLEGPVAFLILTAHDETNLETLRTVRKSFPGALTIVRASNQAMVEEAGAAGADYVVDAASILSKATVRDLEELEIQRRTDNLVRIIEQAGNKGLTIFTHNSPDPDCIASALALQRIADHVGVPSRVYYSGRIGHQQNRMLVNILGIEMTHLDGEEDVKEALAEAGKVAVVDTELAGRNNPLPRDFVPDIVIGHHETREGVPGEHVDVRGDVGAVSTILWTYLMELSITPDTNLATALLHAIRVDTNNFTRKFSNMDMKAVANIQPLADPKLVEEIENPPMSPDTVDVLARAITNRHVRAPYLASCVDFISDRDTLPQAAEFLLHLEGVATVLVFGIMDSTIHVSGRTNDPRVNLAHVLQEAFGKDNAGGHAQAAAGQIPLGILGEVDNRNELLTLVDKVVRKQFFNAVGAVVEEREREREREKKREKEKVKEKEKARTETETEQGEKAPEGSAEEAAQEPPTKDSSTSSARAGA